MTQKPDVHIIGSGLAGTEAAYFLAERGLRVRIHEMRPIKMTEAHHTDACAELVCSNSLKSKVPESAPGILKAEMKALGSLILSTAEQFQVPAGDALAVDRELFSRALTQKLKTHPNIEFINEEVTTPQFGDDTPVLIATGPLTSEKLGQWILDRTREITGASDLYFYDAIAPIVETSSIDMDHAFIGNRYGKGGEDAYINCPLNEEEYNAFIQALMEGETVPSKNFEKEIFFQGCQPIEAIAATGKNTLRFGPMKPMGLDDPKTGRRPFAVVQLRPENHAKTAYNIVGFQTKLKYGAQSKVLRMIPALRKAEFLRMGSIHRNTYICSPKVLRPDLSLKGYPKIYFAGQITGVEGYLESSACGLLAALFIRQRLQKKPIAIPPLNTGLGSLHAHLTLTDSKNFQPNNIQFALFNPHLYDLPEKCDKDQTRKLISQQSFHNFTNWMQTCAPHS